MPSRQQRPHRNVFQHLLASMVAFGLLTGLLFPFVVKALLHSEAATSIQFMALCLGAGLLVGLANYLLFHLVISRELDKIIRGMQIINSNIQECLTRDLSSHSETYPCTLEVTSCDRLGDVVEAFNKMGRTIDKRQHREYELRRIMSILSGSVDLDFIGQTILKHLPLPHEWGHSLLYSLGNERLRLITSRNMAKDSLAAYLSLEQLDIFASLDVKDILLAQPDGTCFERFRLLSNGARARARTLVLVPLGGDGKTIGLLVAFSENDSGIADLTRCQLRSFCDHVQPYLRNAILHNTIEELAITDELSQTLNRRAGISRLKEEYSSAIRHDTPLSLILLDIDHFKKINDEYGHLVGDKVIRLLCDRIRLDIRDEDTLFRYGGEEFVLILPHIGLNEAVQCAERLRRIVRSKPLDQAHPHLQVRISLGVVSTRNVTIFSPDTLIDLADQALYRAKKDGRDRIAVSMEEGVVSLEQYYQQYKGGGGR